jgi:hypothetical protein
MYKKVISGFEAMRRNFVPRKLLVLRKMVVRVLGRANRHILFEFLVLIVLLSSVGIIAASRWSATTIPSRGDLRIVGVGVYQDANCSVAMRYLDWGTVEPGSTKNILLYVRNEGNYVATLYLATNSWNPGNASDYMSLSWNYNGETLSPRESIRLILTLSVSADAKNMDSFSFNVILGTNE